MSDARYKLEDLAYFARDYTTKIDFSPERLDQIEQRLSDLDRLGSFAWQPFLLASVIFGLEHREWLAGILCGFAYQGLVCWKKRLGDAITAHSITNLLLGLWVVWQGAWQFW